MRCPKCGRFVSLETVWVYPNEHSIDRVDAFCKKCGLVNPNDWTYEMFYSDSPENRKVADTDYVECE